MFKQLLQRIRRNHALEHATINLLSQHYPEARVVGLSGPLGFTLYTALPVERVIPVVMQALRQLQHGAANLRIHAHCGTNLVVKATLTTLATLVGLGLSEKRSWRERLGQLPHLVLLNTLALSAADPLALWVQANLTTATDLQTVEIASIFTDLQGNYQRIRVHTRQS